MKAHLYLGALLAGSAVSAITPDEAFQSNVNRAAAEKAGEEQKPESETWPYSDLTPVPTMPGQVPYYIDRGIHGDTPPEPLELPEDVAALVAFLPEDMLEFLKSGHTRAAVRPEAMYDRIRRFQTEARITAYVDAIMTVRREMEFVSGRDPEYYALDTSASGFNNWRLLRPRELDPPREAGPLSMSRYIGGRGSGFPTFAGAPVAFTPEDLIAGKVDVAIFGAPLDMGSGYRDAQNGPRAMRMLRQNTSGTDVYTMATPGNVLNIVDYGNAAVDQNSTERSMQEVRRLVREVATTGAIPFIIGGDHSLEYPNIAGLADVYGKGKVGVIHFDAHLDTGRGRTMLMNHGAPIYRVMKEGHVRPEDYIQVGLRANYSAENYAWQRLIGMRYHTMAEIVYRGWEATMERVLQEANENTEYLYISFDVDVLDPSDIPGTGTPVSGGLTMREAIPIIRRLCAESNVIGFDIVELAPQLDPTYRSAVNGNALMYACLVGLALRKSGNTQKNYFSPLTTEHGQTNYYGDMR